MQFPNHGQWWSKFSTQLSHFLQWDTKGPLKILQVWQYLTLNFLPRIKLYIFLFSKKTDLESFSIFLFDLGKTPGSEKMQISKNNRLINAIIVS